MRVWQRAALPWALLLLAGCGTKYAPVSGMVTLDGVPLADASVTFQPVADKGIEAGTGSYGHTDAQGRYTLKTVLGDRAGAVPGKHMVRISRYQADPGGNPDVGGREILPARYNLDTTLTAEVPRAGLPNADFKLQSDRRRR